MAYGTLADVQGLLAQFTIDAASKPTATQAGVIVTDISNEIDGRLSGAGFTVPVTMPTYFVDWLALLNAYGAAAAVLKSMFPDAIEEGKTPVYAFWEARYKDGLKAISDGSVSPPESPTNSNVVIPSTYLTNNPDEELDLGAIAEPMFKVGTKY